MKNLSSEFRYFVQDLGWGLKIFRENVILFIFLCILGSIFGFLIAFYSPPIYKAQSKFILREAPPSSLIGSLGSLGSFLGASSNSSLDRIVSVVSTEKIIGKVLLQEEVINEKNDLIINHFIRLNYLRDHSKKNDSISNVKFHSSDTVPLLFDYTKRNAYKSVILELTTERGIVEASFDKKTGIVSLNVNFTDEDFAIKVNELIFDQIGNFVRDQASETASLNTAVLTKKVDSIQGELNAVRRQLARKTDQSLGLLLNEDKVELKSLSVKEQILLTMYGEAQKNLETVLFMGQSASNATNITLLDRPFSPIKPIKKSKLLFTFSGFVLTFFFTFGFILIRRWYKNLIAS